MSKRLIPVLALAFAATSAAAAPVAAPTPPTGRALLLIPLQLTKVRDLSFGTVIPGTTAGTVTIDPSTGARAGSPQVTLDPNDIGGRGYFAGAGSPGQQVVMAITPPTVLTDGFGNNINVVALFLDGPATRTIHPVDRTFYVGVGGALQIGADQPDGFYSATFNLTADYM